MNEARARLYLAAARDDPLVAAWIRILDEHQLPARTEVAPVDWQEAFADLFWLGLVSADVFNAIDFKHRLCQLIPSTRAIDRALSRLADLRAEGHHQEYLMDKFDPFGDPKALALRGAEPHRALTKKDPPSPLSSNAPAPFDMLAAPARATGPLAPSAPSSRSSALDGSSLAATRRALERPADLPCHRVGSAEDEAGPGDPRTYIKDFDVHFYCCGEELELIYENGEEVGTREDSDAVLVEFCFYAACPHCKSEKHIHETRPLPADAWR